MIPNPIKFDVEKRIEDLRNYLNPSHPEYERHEQHSNIREAIKLYEEGRIDGMERAHIMNGRRVSHAEMMSRTTWGWTEVGFPRCLL